MIESNILLCVCIHAPRNRVKFSTSPSPDFEMRADPRYVFPSALSACIHTLYYRTSPCTGYLPAFLVPSRHASKTPLFLPSPSESSPAST